MPNGTVLRSIRVDKDLVEWFDERFPWRGSLPQFVNEAIAGFKVDWGDRKSPHEVLSETILRLSKRK